MGKFFTSALSALPGQSKTAAQDRWFFLERQWSTARFHGQDGRIFSYYQLFKHPAHENRDIIEDDLAHLGIAVHVIPLDFRAMLNRVFESFDYEAAIMSLGEGDADPNPEMNVWLSSGSTHLWHLGEAQPTTEWEGEVDQLMEQQMTTLVYEKRKKLYDRVQQLIAENLPVIFLATPDVLVGAKSEVGNFHPAVLDHYTLWNADQLYLRRPPRGLERAGIR